MEWRFQRRLVLRVSGDWVGWFCERCHWNVQRPTNEEDVSGWVTQIRDKFDEHSCEDFAQLHWRKEKVG